MRTSPRWPALDRAVLCAAIAALCTAGSVGAAPRTHAFSGPHLARHLVQAAPGVDPRAVDLAVQSLDCALRSQKDRPNRLVLIDYSRPSTETRLWVFDLKKRALTFAERVAHGKASGENLTTRFSNQPGSLQTSLGMFRTSETYQGRNGYSLRLDGLEPGFNDRARERAIVVHGAPYVSDGTIERLGRLGRSWGCPAVPSTVAQSLIDDIKGGQYVFAYYPDPAWLNGSPLLRCPSAEAPRRLAAGLAGKAGQS